MKKINLKEALGFINKFYSFNFKLDGNLDIVTDILVCINKITKQNSKDVKKTL